MSTTRILLVEDEEDIRRIARMSLERIGGFEVEECPLGVHARETATRFAPDLILLDVMMPGMDGPSTLTDLRSDDATRAIPVVFMTAKVQPQEKERFIGLGALGVIAKPFDPMTLSDTVREYLSHESAHA